ncbi:NACHT domain-containing protein, partial [Pseudomonadota bacterium]
LREFFFGEVELSTEWFGDKIQEAILALDERFHPEDHVDVRIEKLFPVIARAPSYREELLKELKAVESCKLPGKQLSGLQQCPEKEVIDDLRDAVAELLTIDAQISLDQQHKWGSKNWLDLAGEVLAANDKFQSWCYSYKHSLDDEERGKYELSQFIKESNALEDVVGRLATLLRSRYMDAENKGFAIIRGNAGSGKSHVVAKCAQNAIEQDQPAILLLGQRLNDGELWAQISHILGLPTQTADQILGALDAAGKLADSRALLLIDAINEGIGSRFWRNQIASLIHKLKDFSHVSCVISCRTEYFELAIPKSIADQYPVFDIRGFETPEEQLNAARVYLDRRGIARPSTPWLSPEFINPLFLRSVCVSLERDKKSEFPPGLTGTSKILKYYLESVGRNIAEKEGSTISQAPKIGRAVKDIAGKMLNMKEDFLALDVCRDVIASHFQNINPRTEPDWLSIFLNNGILRKDPNPSTDDFADEDIVRFSFQRFQDFLMAEYSLNNVERGDGLFDEDGMLGFCIENDHFAWEWRGLIDALAVALPEKFEIELVDTLPGGVPKWWDDWATQETFTESVKWRSHSAFTDRTLELLNNITHHNPSPIELLLQVAVSADHPWNAELIHRNLQQRKLPDRDEFWTTWVNDQSDDAESSIGVVIEWCRVGQAPHTNPENQFLAALVLCWFFTSTHRAIRDKSTKALTNILLVNEDVFIELLNRFADIDDLYILERLLAAAYASCCLCPDKSRLEKYSEATFEHIFKDGKPPYGILLRDYAFGIIECASSRSVLPNDVDLELCKPPYKSPKFRLTISEEMLKEIAKKAGGDEIVDSTTGFMGDFSTYEIEPRAGHFLRLPLSRDMPLSSEQKKRLFEDDVIGNDRQRMQALEDLENTLNPYSYGIYSLSFGVERKNPTKTQIDNWREDIDIAKESFLGLLSEEEIRRFRLEALPYLLDRSYDSQEEIKFDIDAIKRWVAKRAYDYGWTKERFEHDRSRQERYSRERPGIERIGKKYQWLALDEALSRLADNYWMEGEYGDLPKAYSNPLDVGFERDIDPTIINEGENHDTVSEVLNSWSFKPLINLDQVEESKLVSWPFEKDPAVGIKNFPVRIDDNGVKWLVLYEHQSKTERYDEKNAGEHGSRMQEFRFLATVMVKSCDAREIANNFKKNEKMDIMHWAASDVTDAAFLYEAPWRNTWPQEKWSFDSHRLPTGIGYAQMAANYCWESHLDVALPDGYSSHLPSAWIAKELDLYADLTTAGVWRDKEGEIVFREYKGEEGGKVCLLRMDKANEVMGDEYTILSVFISERNVWPGGCNDFFAGRRAEGVCWRDGRGMNSFTWSRDIRNGISGKKNKS